MWKDITTVVPSKTGMDVVLYNVLICSSPIGDGWNWDVLGCMQIDDEDDQLDLEYVAVSIAVKGFTPVVASKMSKGSIVKLSGKFGKIEKSNSGRERFRRIFCDMKDVELLGRAPGMDEE